MYLKLLKEITTQRILMGLICRAYFDYTLIPFLHTYILGKSCLLFAFSNIPKTMISMCL